MFVRHMIAALVGALLLAPPPVGADAPADVPERRPRTLQDVERAMLTLCRVAPRHPVRRSPTYRAEVAGALFHAAEAAELPPLFVVSVAYRESSFRTTALGKLGEVGLGQVNRHARAWCAAKGIDQETAAGQALCSARWLNKCRADCGGGLRAGFVLYATGRTCTEDTEALRKTVDSRFDLWERLEQEADRHVRPPVIS